MYKYVEQPLPPLLRLKSTRLPFSVAFSGNESLKILVALQYFNLL